MASLKILLLPLYLLWLLLRLLFCYLEAGYKFIAPGPPKRVAGKVVLVTGAAQGIGRQLALKLGKLGAKLVLWDIDKNGCDETATMITESGGFARAYVCDVSSVDNVKEMAQAVKYNIGEVDIVVNNAGIFNGRPLLSLSEAEIRRTFDINCLAHYWIVQQFLPSMLDRNEGHIVTVASLAGKLGSAIMTDYCGSKFAAVGFTDALYEELRRKGSDIKLTTVCPFFTNTNMMSKVKVRVEPKDRLGRILEPEEVAEAIIKGMRHNRHFVYIPGDLQISVRLNEWLPRKARDIMYDLFQSGFYEKD